MLICRRLGDGVTFCSPCHVLLCGPRQPPPARRPLDNTGQFVQPANAGVVFIGSQTSSSLFPKENISGGPPLTPPPPLHQTAGSGEE